MPGEILKITWKNDGCPSTIHLLSHTWKNFTKETVKHIALIAIKNFSDFEKVVPGEKEV